MEITLKNGASYIVLHIVNSPTRDLLLRNVDNKNDHVKVKPHQDEEYFIGCEFRSGSIWDFLLLHTISGYPILKQRIADTCLE